jgi:hypothetical protein
MSTQTIRAAQFMYYVPTGRTRQRKDGTTEDILSVRHALRGDTVNIPRDEDVERGERAGAFMVEIESGPVATEEVVVEENPGPDFSSHDMLVEWFEDARPSARTVVNAAEGDADKAEMLLAAEDTASGGHSRKTVVTALNRIIDEVEAEEAAEAEAAEDEDLGEEDE